MKRFTSLPLTLYRIQGKLPVKLRDFDTQKALGRSSFDLKRHNGLVLPMEGDVFHTPNGMSLRPASQAMDQILEGFKDDVQVYRLHAGLPLPKHFVLFHEHSDHYSLQTAEPVSLEDFNERLTKFLEQHPFQNKKQFQDFRNDPDDQDS